MNTHVKGAEFEFEVALKLSFDASDIRLFEFTSNNYDEVLNAIETHIDCDALSIERVSSNQAIQYYIKYVPIANANSTVIYNIIDSIRERMNDYTRIFTRDEMISIIKNTNESYSADDLHSTSFDGVLCDFKNTIYSVTISDRVTGEQFDGTIQVMGNHIFNSYGGAEPYIFTKG